MSPRPYLEGKNVAMSHLCRWPFSQSPETFPCADCSIHQEIEKHMYNFIAICVYEKRIIYFMYIYNIYNIYNYIYVNMYM